MEKKQLRFIDTLQFFQQPLADLSSTYNIDIEKGYFPHYFNTRENQNYIGDIPIVDQFGINKMTSEKYNDFQKWYDVAKTELYDFNHEMVKYCRADVELLSTAVL